jgi:hypothetical protein
MSKADAGNMSVRPFSVERLIFFCCAVDTFQKCVKITIVIPADECCIALAQLEQVGNDHFLSKFDFKNCNC